MDLVTFSEKILNGKLQFLWSVEIDMWDSMQKPFTLTFGPLCCISWFFSETLLRRCILIIETVDNKLFQELIYENMILTLFRMGFFEAAHGWGGGVRVKRSPFPKICHTYPIMMKLGTVIPYLMKTPQKYESRDTPLELCWHQDFFIGNQQIWLYQKIQT